MTFFLLLLFATQSFALELPANLTASDRDIVMETVGLPTSSKYLTNPYPLGGYLGFEFGVSSQFIDTEIISTLGDTNSTEEQLQLRELHIGKGLYNNLDIFLTFAPFNTTDKVRSFGGFLKWGFFQAKFLPINFSLAIAGNTFQVGDSFVHQNLAADLITGVNVDNAAIYFGVGKVEGEAQFMGGAGEGSIIDSNESDDIAATNTVREKRERMHNFVGISLHLSDLFIALQMDRYDSPTFSAKLGLRL